MFSFDIRLLLLLKNVFFYEKSWNREHLEVAVCRCPAKKLPLKILENLQAPCCFLRRDSGIVLFLWILWNFQEQLFYRLSHVDRFLTLIQSFEDSKTCCERYPCTTILQPYQWFWKKNKDYIFIFYC